MADEERRFPVAYRIDCKSDGFSHKELKKRGFSGTDAVVLISLRFPPDGTLKDLVVSRDANGKELDIDEVFKAWCILAKCLSESESLQPGKRLLTQKTFDIVKDAVVGHMPKA